ncbi:mannose-6-phosphate isomerase, class I [Aerococcaceae bacterium zg-BR9]|uniref:mannose-6-phosphate isomerase, class I n=1 Tax=Aerococcaceae bacterium zg-1292 TaxID=2774330 RepID=UPI004063A150|nr:mannose-6-phosphate isomerase, class I [Aerococcaceae bacterium zg-BR9]MBF6977812.1 mannose-6-phosphate isomerase, class I [Aerococcaceae bacterium zg-BR22]
MSELLFLESVMHEKIWGGSRLKSEFDYKIPSDQTGEYWAISAHPNGTSQISNGNYKGIKLDTLYKNHRELFGDSTHDTFPLLIKILDANQWLSVQVHPDDTYAIAHDEKFGKTECWYILSAEDNAEIIYGHNANDIEELSQMIEENTWDKLLCRVKVHAGDFFYVPSGTLHAIGPGIMILEIQQSSDTTYRVYDFKRLDTNGNCRALHISQALDVITIGHPNNSVPITQSTNDLQHTTLLTSNFFIVYKWKISGKAEFSQFAPYLLVSVIGGYGQIATKDFCYSLSKGQHFIVPNNVETWKIVGEIEMIVCHI